MDVRDRLATAIDGRRDLLTALSHGIHGDAEVAFEEHRSSQRVAEALAANGFAVEHGVAGLDTALVARAGAGPLRIGICAEYDALPGIGHACGHNIIASAAVGAALSLAEVADDLGIEVVVLGTPAEEGGGGKVLMLERGAFDGLNAAMMVHPAATESPQMACLAVQHFDVRYRGRAAHASAYPELGINAADALTVAQVGIGLLRQHVRPTDRIHGIVTDGGDAPNIVPARAGGTWFVRSRTLRELGDLYPRVQRCFEAGAIATGATVSFDEPSPAYSEFLADPDLAEIYVAEAEAIGRRFPAPGEEVTLTGSTDMANVSLAMPAIHPTIAIDARGAVNHQPEFTAACIGPSADQAVRDGALAMARTVAVVAAEGEVRDRLQSRTHVAGQRA